MKYIQKGIALRAMFMYRSLVLVQVQRRYVGIIVKRRTFRQKWSYETLVKSGGYIKGKLRDLYDGDAEDVAAEADGDGADGHGGRAERELEH